MPKTSIRFFENIPVRAVWDEESSRWWFCAVDIAEALTKSKNPRVYWATLKRRNSELFANCKQLKLKARDGKFYNTDVVDESGLNTVIALIPGKKSEAFIRWMKNMETSLDEKANRKHTSFLKAVSSMKSKSGRLRACGKSTDTFSADFMISPGRYGQ